MATEYLTAIELAKLLRLSAETVRQMARAGKIPSIRISPKVIRSASGGRRDSKTLRSKAGCP